MKPFCKIEIITTGDELVFGQLVDSNSPWIAKRSTEVGGSVKRVTSVGDNVADIVNAIERSLSEELDLIVITGGLGPSHDDLTVEALSKAIGSKVIDDERALEMLEERCNEFSIDFSTRRKRMARLIEGAEPLKNSVGLAPGMKITIGKTLLFALPGVPKEMKPMFNNYVLPFISSITRNRSIAITFHIFMPRYRVFPILNDIHRLFPEAYIKSHSTSPNHEKNQGLDNGLKVNVIVWEKNRGNCKTQLDKIKSKITELVEEQGGRVTVEPKEKST